MHNVRLVNLGTVMDSASVAQAGYDGMLAGKRLVIPGLVNKITAQSVRATPRAIVLKIVRYLNSER
jgi:short-subunit dehydrogenase